jgi:hypothetical protein
MIIMTTIQNMILLMIARTHQVDAAPALKLTAHVVFHPKRPAGFGSRNVPFLPAPPAS